LSSNKLTEVKAFIVKFKSPVWMPDTNFRSLYAKIFQPERSTIAPQLTIRISSQLQFFVM
ncbi:MAG: hypothetical protein V4447_06765, partial [Pseudomonadota bacterium]